MHEKLLAQKEGKPHLLWRRRNKKKNQPPDRQTYVTMSKEEEGREGEKGKGLNNGCSGGEGRED